MKSSFATVMVAVFVFAVTPVRAGGSQAQAARAPEDSDAVALADAKSDLEEAKRWTKWSYLLATVAGGVAVMGAVYADPIARPARRQSFDDVTGLIGLGAGVAWVTGHVKRRTANRRISKLSVAPTVDGVCVSVGMAW